MQRTVLEKVTGQLSSERRTKVFPPAANSPWGLTLRRVVASKCGGGREPRCIVGIWMDWAVRALRKAPVLRNPAYRQRNPFNLYCPGKSSQTQAGINSQKAEKYRSIKCYTCIFNSHYFFIFGVFSIFFLLVSLFAFLSLFIFIVFTRSTLTICFTISWWTTLFIYFRYSWLKICHHSTLNFLKIFFISVLNYSILNFQ